MRSRSPKKQGFEPLDREKLAERADQEPRLIFDPKYFVKATARGAFPGHNYVDALMRVRGELGSPHLSFLPELPKRGYHATVLARTICALEGLSADGTASGWRIRTGRGLEHEQAYSLFASDINVLADCVGAEKSYRPEPYKLQLLGPVSLAASVYASNGELLISDAGARRDLLQSLIEGIKPWISNLAEATGNAPLILQFEEPLVDAAMKGAIATSSGYKTYRHVPLHEVEGIFSALHEELAAECSELIFDMPSHLNKELYRYGAGVSFSLENSSTATWEELAFLIERGKQVWLGVQNPSFFVSAGERARWFVKNWRTVGLPFSALTQVTLHDTPGLENLNPDTATRVLQQLTDIATAVAELATESY